MTLRDTDTEPATASEPAPQRPPKPGGISMGPAMIVGALAVLILVVFVTIGVLSSHSSGPAHQTSPRSGVPGTTLRAEPAAALLSPIVRTGEPPANVRAAVSVPAGSVRVSHHDNSGGASQFDSQVVFRSGDSQAALETFFAADMRRQGWQVFDRGPAANDPGAFEVLGKLAGSDGYYWEMGATVKPTTFPRGGPPRGVTDFTIRLFQTSDAM